MRRAVCGALLAATVFGGPEAAQAAEPKPLLHEFIFVQIAPGKRPEFIEFLNKEYFALEAQDENIKSIRYYIEDRAKWSMVVDLAYEDYAGAGRSQSRFMELLAKRYPDPADRTKFLNKFQSFVVDHDHMFFRDMPELSK